jgi:hypothetical protein
MSANKFVLTHHQIEVDYTVGISPGLTALTYKDGAEVKTFKSNEITTNDTALGSLVSIPLLLTVDTGGERFGFLLPQIDVARGQTTDFKTVGVHETFGGPDSIPHVAPTWRCIELRGTAQTVIVPL